MSSASSLNSASPGSSTIKLQNGDKSIPQMHDEKQRSMEIFQEQKERELSLKKYELALYKRDIEYKEKELKFRMLQWDREQKKVG